MKNNRWDTSLINDDDEEWLPQDSNRSWLAATLDFILTFFLIAFLAVAFVIGLVTMCNTVWEITK